MSESLDNHLVHGRRQRPDGPSPIDVISVQSQLVYGHAGNSAAVPPMRELGVRVAEIPTVLLSNAPFYDTTRGRVLPADWFADLLLGTHERGLPQRAKMLVSGYFGSTANVANRVKSSVNNGSLLHIVNTGYTNVADGSTAGATGGAALGQDVAGTISVGNGNSTITGTGKIRRRQANRHHLMEHKPTKRTRRLDGQVTVEGKYRKHVDKLLGH